MTELASSRWRGESLGLLGVVNTLPSIFGAPLGLWLVEYLGFGVVFLLGGAAPLLGLVAVLATDAVPSLRRNNGESVARFLSGLARGPLLPLLLLFAPSAVAFGAAVTFLSLAVPASGPFSAPLALLLLGATSTFGRWWTGRFSDRHDAHSLLAPGLLCGVFGAVALSTEGPA